MDDVNLYRNKNESFRTVAAVSGWIMRFGAVRMDAFHARYVEISYGVWGLRHLPKWLRRQGIWVRYKRVAFSRLCSEVVDLQSIISIFKKILPKSL